MESKRTGKPSKYVTNARVVAHGMLIVKGKGSKERRVALGNNC